MNCLLVLFVMAASAQNSFPNGKSKLGSRMLGGQEVVPHSIKYQAALLVTHKDQNKSVCSGALISERFVLTTVRCVHDYQTVDVVLGCHDLVNQEENRQQIHAEKVHIHEKFSDFLYIKNDIALVKLAEEATLNDFVTTIKLPLQDQTWEGSTGVASSWANNHLLTSLKAVVDNFWTCKALNAFFLSEDTLCSSDPDHKSAICPSDPGTPFVVDGFLVGLSSKGVSSLCPLSTVYTKVTKHLNWIQENIEDK